MSRKTLTIIVASILILFALAIGAYYYIIGGGQNGGNGDSGFKIFSPFGGDNYANPDNSTTTDNTQQPVTDNQPDLEYLKKLRKISTEPVSGFGIQNIKAGTLVRYVEKATGHIYEVEMFSPRKERISNTTIPLAYDAVWGNNNNSFASRYLDADNQTLNTYLLNIGTSNSTSSERTISSIQLPQGVMDISVWGNRVFYLTKNSLGSSGFIVSFDNKINNKVWASDISELNSQFVNDKILALTTKPDPKVPGFMYYVDTRTGVTKRIMGGINGLSTLSNPTGNSVLYLDQGNNFGLGIYTLKDGSNYSLFPTTFPEKCVWGRTNNKLIFCAVPKESISQNSLTSWYQGRVSFSDNIWFYSTENSTLRNIEDLETDAGEKIDVLKIMISEDDKYLFFVNKMDNSLWSLDLGMISTTTPTN